MSLLLDALKKAAQEKQRASAAGDDSSKTPDDNSEIELTLDEPVVEDSEHNVVRQAETPEKRVTVEPPRDLEKASATTSTVSDEALHMLVHKTNKQFRQKRKMIWGVTLATVLFILIAGGVYYYYVMLEEVEALERKHTIAMRLFESQAVTSTRKVPAAEPAVVPVQAEVITKKPVQSSITTPQTKRIQKPVQKQRVFSVTRSEKKHPISVLLNDGWHAYGNENYTAASAAYNKVLEREPRNRDALLGRAAIAMKQGEYNQARATYSILLRLDPRDQIAASALSNLDEVTPDTLSETKLKFMVQQQPDAPHLHFALGNFYAKQAKWPQAQGEYFSAWHGDSENADYAFNLAVSLDQLGKTDEAKRFYETSLKLSSGKNISFSVDSVKDRLSEMAAKQ